MRAGGVDLRLAVPAAVAWSALALGLGAPAALPPAAGGAAVVALVCLALFATRLGPKVLALPAVAAAAASLVLCSAAVRLPERSPPALDAALEAGGAEIAAVVHERSKGPTDVTIVAIDGSATELPAVLFAEGSAPVEVGSTVAARVELVPTEPGDGAVVLAFADGGTELVTGPSGWLAWAGEWRAGLRERAATLPGEGGDLLPGLAIGDTSAVGDDLDAAMTVSSLTHLTAVSGANCAIVVGFALAAAGAAGLRRPLRVAVALAALGAFVVLVTPEPSVMRAAVMAAVVLGALASGRPAAGVPVLALTVLGLLVADPWLARDYAFTLSVLATAGLLVIAAPLTALLSRVMPTPLAATLAVPVAAQLACQPVLLTLEPTIPVYGVLANVLAAPAAPVATVVGLAGCVLLVVAPPLGAAATALAWLPAAWIVAVARFVEQLPFSRLPWPAGPTGVALLAGATVLALVCLLARRRPKLRLAVASVLAAALVCHVAAVGTSGLVRRLGMPADWQFAQCDVGQGDALLVRSAGATALVDTGQEPERLAACLDDLGIDRLDLVVLTHFDHDHVGGASAVVGTADVVLSGPVGEEADRRLLDDLRAGGAQVREVAAGEQGLLGELRWRVLWPPAIGAPEPGNDASVVLALTGVGACRAGCLSALLLGDLGESAQAALARAARPAPVDVVKVAHHGSADQDAELYAALGGTVGLIGVGADNDYGHPTPELLGMLASAGTAPLRSDVDGLVLVAPGTDGAVRVWTDGVGGGG
ncbi:ComEC/Rec2 family competence protein [Herbiconiux sp. SYSU D00978]|uniref:ComEC/Rec2 family competence protein n=1 Tax=Herbiconiux sp. SYSU D00978 TaxID=2812562 RepID=UPI001A96549F|nr:ComEC/Rec2 family competence protein [Herbiconiux sp. SYSU D00978]